jgi:hypothetical protein
MQKQRNGKSFGLIRRIKPTANGKLTYGWSNGEGESFDNSKETATEVCIFLGDIKENNATA